MWVWSKWFHSYPDFVYNIMKREREILFVNFSTGIVNINKREVFDTKKNRLRLKLKK